MKKILVVFMLVGVMIAFASCSPAAESDATRATETLAAETSISDATTAGTTTETTAEAMAATTIMPVTQATTKQTTAFSLPANVKSEYRSEDDSLLIDVSSFNLKATPDNDQAIVRAIRTAYPSFDPAGYSVSRVINEVNDYFYVHYNLIVGEYTTTKGYEILVEGDQAAMVFERGVSLSVPSAAAIAKLPAVTEKIIQAAKQQGIAAVYERNPDFVVQEQECSAFYNLATGECFYNVRNIYTTSATSPYKGVVDTKYKIA